jgi:hypothetical protein
MSCDPAIQSVFVGSSNPLAIESTKSRSPEPTRRLPEPLIRRRGPGICEPFPFGKQPLQGLDVGGVQWRRKMLTSRV